LKAASRTWKTRRKNYRREENYNLKEKSTRTNWTKSGAGIGQSSYRRREDRNRRSVNPSRTPLTKLESVHFQRGEKAPKKARHDVTGSTQRLPGRPQPSIAEEGENQGQGTRKKHLHICQDGRTEKKKGISLDAQGKKKGGGEEQPCGKKKWDTEQWTSSHERRHKKREKRRDGERDRILRQWGRQKSRRNANLKDGTATYAGSPPGGDWRREPCMPKR